jgi:hypothetical protein
MSKHHQYFWLCLWPLLAGACVSRDRNVSRVSILYMSTSIETIISVSCEHFDVNLAKDSLIKMENFSDNSQIHHFMSALREYTSPPLVNHLDVRAKAFIYYSTGKISSVCVDQFGDFELDGKYLGVSKPLLMFIQENCNGFK